MKRGAVSGTGPAMQTVGIFEKHRAGGSADGFHQGRQVTLVKLGKAETVTLESEELPFVAVYSK